MDAVNIMSYATTVSYSDLATAEQIQRAKAAVEARGIKIQLVDTPLQALEKVQQIIPAKADVMTGGSQTLREIGFEGLLLDNAHPWNNLKAAMLAESDPDKQGRLRAQSTLSNYYLGSVQAIAETGEIVIASGTGSQIPAYAFSSQNVVWIVGAQKIVPTLDAALRRVREYALPQEDARLKALGYPGAALGKILIFEQEAPFLQRNVNLILVNQVVGV